MGFLDYLETDGSSDGGFLSNPNEKDKEDWSLDAGNRMKESLLQGFGGLWGMIGAAADAVPGDTKVMQSLESFAMRRGSELMEKAADLDVYHTDFSDVNLTTAEGIENGGKYAIELATSFIPDIAMMFAGGAGAGTAATKLATKKGGAQMLEAFAKKRLKKNARDLAVKEGLEEGSEELLKLAYKKTAGDIGGLAGTVGYEASRMSGEAYQYDKEMRGEDASGLRALGVGSAAGAIATFSPLNRLMAKGLAGKSMGGKATSLLTTPIGEAFEEAGQETVMMLNEAGIDPRMTIGAIMESGGWDRLLESAVGGALLGEVYGGLPSYLMRDKSKPEAASVEERITENPEAVLNESGIDTSQDAKPVFPRVAGTEGTIRETTESVAEGTEEVGATFDQGEALTATISPEVSNLFTENEILKSANMVDRKKEVDNERATAKSIEQSRAGESPEGVKVFPTEQGPVEDTEVEGQTQENEGAPEAAVVEEIQEPVKTEEEYTQEAELREEVESVPFSNQEEQRVTQRELEAEAEAEGIRDSFEPMQRQPKDGWQAGRYSVEGQRKEAYRKDNQTIVRRNKKYLDAWIEEDGEFINYGQFTKIKDAKEALDQGLTADEYYRKDTEGKTRKKAIQKLELDENQKKVLEEANVDKIATVARKTEGIPSGTFDEEIYNAIYNSVTNWDPEQSKFETWATNQARFAIKNAQKDGTLSMDGMTVDSKGGSEAGTFKDSLTAGDVKGRLPIDTTKVTTVNVGDTASQKLYQREDGEWVNEDGVSYGPKKGEARSALEEEMRAELESTVKTIEITPEMEKKYNKTIGDKKTQGTQPDGSFVEAASAKSIKELNTIIDSDRKVPRSIMNATKAEREAWYAWQDERGVSPQMGVKEVVSGKRPVGMAAGRAGVSPSEEVQEAKDAGLLMDIADNGMVIYGRNKEDIDNFIKKYNKGLEGWELSKELGYTKEQYDIVNTSKWSDFVEAANQEIYHGTEVDNLEGILNDGLSKGSALDTSKNKDWAKESPIQVVFNGLKVKLGEFVKHNSYYKAANSPKPDKVIIDFNSISGQAANELAAKLDKLKKNNPDVAFETKGSVPDPDTAFTKSNVVKFFQNEMDLNKKDATDMASEYMKDIETDRPYDFSTMDQWLKAFNEFMVSGGGEPIKATFGKSDKKPKRKKVKKTTDQKVDQIVREERTIGLEEETKRTKDELQALIDEQAMDMDDDTVLTSQFDEEGMLQEDLYDDRDEAPKEVLPEISPAVAMRSYGFAERAGFNSQKALELFDKEHGLDPKDPELRAVRENLVRVNNKKKEDAARLSKRYKNGLELLEDSVEKSDNKIVSTLGRMLLNHAPTRAKLAKVPVEVVSSGSSSYYSGINTIKMAVDAGVTGIHEVVHSITVNEMDNNKELRDEVMGMLSVARSRISQDPKWKNQLTPDLIAFLEDLETSKDFKESQEAILMALPQELQRDANSVLYGLLNHKEFLSQAFTSKTFQDFLKTVEVEAPPSVKTKSKWTVWKRLTEAVGKLFGIKGKRITLLQQAIEVVPRLAEQQGYSGLVSNEVSESEAYFMGQVNGTVKETPPEVWTERRKTLAKDPRKDTTKGKLSKFYKDAKRLGKAATQSVTETVRGVGTEFLTPLRRMEMSISRANTKLQQRVKPFIEEYKKLKDADKSWLDYLLINRDDKETQAQLTEFLKNKPKLKRSLGEVDVVLSEIYDRAKKNSMHQYKDKAQYFPRRVIDITALMQDIKGDPEYGAIQAQLDSLKTRVKDAEGKWVEKEATESEKQEAVRKMLNTGRFPALALTDPTAMKRRQINKISSKWRKHYETSDQALINHIYEMNESIGIREFFRDPDRFELVKKRDKMYKALEDGEKVDMSELALIEAKLEDQDSEINSAVENMIAEKGSKLNDEQQDALMRALRARLTQRGMSGAASSVRNLALATALASPTSAITQIGDLAFSFYNNGVYNTIAGLGDALAGRNLIKPEDMDLTGSLKEFQTSGTAKYVDNVLKWTGLKYADTKFKQTTMNAVLRKAKKMSFEEFQKKYGDIYQEETKKTYNDIKAGKKTEQSMFFAFNELSDFQPVSLSEMPAMYLTGGNGRIFYALKSYNIRALNTIYRESVYKYQNADNKAEKVKAATDTLRLITFMVMMGAGADELKDWLLNRDAGSFSDSVHENILKTTMLNRYTLSKGFSSDTVKNILADTLIPPTQFISDPMADIRSWVSEDKEPTFKSIRSLPWGKVAYARFIPGGDTWDKTQLQREIMASYADGASFSSIRGKMNKYNAWARKQEDKKPITLSTLAKARQRTRKAKLTKER